MNNNSSTYRIIAAALSLIVFVSVSFPAGLHALGMGEHCAENMEHMHKAAAGMDLKLCEANPQVASGHEHIVADQDMENCELSFACACMLTGSIVKAEAVPLSVKTSVILPVSILGFTTKFETAVTPRKDALKSNVTASPIFLVISSFLN